MALTGLSGHKLALKCKLHFNCTINHYFNLKVHKPSHLLKWDSLLIRQIKFEMAIYKHVQNIFLEKYSSSSITTKHKFKDLNTELLHKVSSF